MPLDITEDTSGRMFSFIQKKGPSHVFQVIRSNSENVNVLRCSCSLLIVTISILQLKAEIESTRRSRLTVRVKSAQGAQNLGTWLSQSLSDICDGGSVQILVQILKYSNMNSINELLLNLLAKIVSVSQEAAYQMISSPGTKKKSDGTVVVTGGVGDTKSAGKPGQAEEDTRKKILHAPILLPPLSFFSLICSLYTIERVSLLFFRSDFSLYNLFAFVHDDNLLLPFIHSQVHVYPTCFQLVHAIETEKR